MGPGGHEAPETPKETTNDIFGITYRYSFRLKRASRTLRISASLSKSSNPDPS